MKLLNVKDIDRFFEAVDRCEGKVELVSKYGDVINLKSDLSKYFSIANILCNKSVIDEIEIRVNTKEDARIMMEFMSGRI